jgi:general secretion pathway protein G
MKNRYPGGFTLIEIMLVIAILGILISVAVPRLAGRTEEARQQATRLQIENLSAALDAFEFDCGRFPTAQEGLEALRQRPSAALNWKGPYLKKPLAHDPWQGAYAYAAPGTHNHDYDVYSPGPDGREGTSDDIGNW